VAQITPQQRQRYGRLLTGLVPGDVLKQIDSAELEDRLVQASGLMRQVAKAATPGAGRQLGEQARQIMAARPRRQTEAIVVAKMAKAKALGDSPQAADLERQAREELLRHPPAVRRVAKAKADGGNDPVVLFDADGRVLGLCDPEDILPVAGATGSGEMAPQPPAEAGIPAQDVAKSGRMIVYDQAGRRFAARGIRTKIKKAADDGLVTVTGPDGRSYQVSPEVLRSAEAQARNTGPVKAGGTTGMGKPRQTGPAASSPGDGPQRAMPGDLADRQVIKALGPQWTEVRDYRGSLVGAVRRADITALPAGRVLKGKAAQTHANVYSSSRRLIGVAKMADIIPLTDLR
jgi:hypothetical protein